MPRRKAISKKTKLETVLPVVEKDFPVSIPKMENQPILTKKNIILAIILLLILGGWIFRRYFIAATVNGQPVSRMELNSQMEKRFGSQVLDNIINERLIMGAVRQKGVFVTAEEIDTKIKDVETKLSGKISLDDALKMQGMTREDMRKQMEIQVSIDKLFSTESTVSSKEVDEYIFSNKESFKNSTNPAQLRLEVTDVLHQQKVSDAFNKWFEDIKKGARIEKYL
jgi:foldase protein PrsA